MAIPSPPKPLPPDPGYLDGDNGIQSRDIPASGAGFDLHFRLEFDTR
jgi:hypothetical protein